MKTLTKEHAKQLINWFESKGQSNWGVWGNYPSLPVGASYLQYEDVQCVVKLDSNLTIIDDGEEVSFNYISSSRKTPGKGQHITFSMLASYCKTEQEKKADRIEGWKKDFARAKDIYAKHELYEAQSNEVKAIITTTLENLAEIHGTPNSKGLRKELENSLNDYIMPTINASMPWAFGEIANSFHTESEYIAYKMAN